MTRRHVILLMAACLLLAGCSSRPGYVLSESKMSSVLADIHMAESVVEMSPSRFGNDSLKMLLKQSVYAAHGITQEDFDTSLVWYGHHMDKYIDVLDKEIALLEERDRKAGAQAREAGMSMAGDSVDLWSGSPYLVLSDRYPSMAVPFEVAIDDNCEPGDRYTWRIKVIDNERPNINWIIAANYADSTIEVLTANTMLAGWNEVTFITDSTRTLTALRGQFLPVLEDNENTMYVDSIQLVRKRVDPDQYGRRYRQRSFKEYR